MQGRRLKGFTLIEILLAMVFVATAMVGIIAMLERAARGALQSDVALVASGLSREKMEMIAMDKARGGFAAVDDDAYPLESFTDAFSIYSRSTSVQEVSKDDFTTIEDDSGFKKVTVTVNWGAALNQRVSLVTVFADY